MQSFPRQEKRGLHPKFRAKVPQVGDCKGRRLHKEQPAYGAESGYDDTRICSDAYIGAQSTAMYP